MQHTEQATAVARATGWNLDTYAADREWSAVGIGPVGQSRDSEALEVSNYRTAQKLLDDAGARYSTCSFGHWAVGWVEEIAYDAGDPGTVEAVEAIRARMADYPVLDEEAYSDEEWSQNHPTDGYCYADPDEECHATDDRGRIVESVEA